jgi:hypothetical protein
MYSLEPQKQTEALRWLMYAWDGQWQAHAAALYGPVEAARLSMRVRSAFGKAEMRALLALVGKERAANLADAAEMLEAYFNFAWGEGGFQGRFLPLETAANGMARLTVQVKKMIGLEALKKAAQAAGEDPRLPYELLWQAWLETLLPDQQTQVTARLGEEYDQFQIDNLGETPANPVAFPGQFAAAPEAGPAAPDLPDEADFENSPIAAALQIPLERVAPGTGELIGPPTLNNPYASGPASYSPSAGAPENRSRRGGTGGLTSRLHQRAENAPPPESATQQPAWNATPPGPPLPPPPPDPNTGRPLYSTDPEEEAKSRVLRSRNLPLMSRLFMSKEARELYDKGKDVPLVQLSSIAEKVDLILQRRLGQARAAYPGQFTDQVRVIGGPEGALQILVGPQRYLSIDQVPPGPVLDLIKQSIEEWSGTAQ